MNFELLHPRDQLVQIMDRIYRIDHRGTKRYAAEHNRRLFLLDGDLFGQFGFGEEIAEGEFPRDLPAGSRLLAPIQPSKIRSLVGELCFTMPFTRVVRCSLLGSSPGTTRGPIGQNVSKPFARAHCLSLRWQSRAETSFAHV